MKNHDRLDEAGRDELNADQFAFQAQRKEPLLDADHVRDAVARLDQVMDVSDEERDRAWGRIQAASKKYGVTIVPRHVRLVHREGEGIGYALTPLEPPETVSDSRDRSFVAKDAR